ncbi:MAG: peptidase carboxypeptidase, partial [Bacteroidetes bacterium]|nr:peptidase carboxypeptidase [Bacteroidota bacterium]
VLPYVSAALTAQQYSCHEYIVGDPGTLIRHSTTEINDGRQSFGIRGSLSWIQEGRKWQDLTDQLERRARSQYAAVEALLDFCAANRREIRRLVREERARIDTIAGKTFYTWIDHVPGGRPMSIPVMDVSTSGLRSWTISPYHGTVVGRDSVRLPAAYLVPGSHQHVHELLAMHNVRGVPAGDTQIVCEEYQIMGFDSLVLESDPYRIPQVRLVEATVEPDSGAMIYPVQQDTGLLLASVLEPRSVWGFAKYARFEELFSGPTYPVRRIVVMPGREAR